MVTEIVATSGILLAAWGLSLVVRALARFFLVGGASTSPPRYPRAVDDAVDVDFEDDIPTLPNLQARPSAEAYRSETRPITSPGGEA